MKNWEARIWGGKVRIWGKVVVGKVKKEIIAEVELKLWVEN